MDTLLCLKNQKEILEMHDSLFRIKVKKFNQLQFNPGEVCQGDCI